MSGRSPPLYCTLTLIAMKRHQENSMKRHQKNSKNKSNVVHLSLNMVVVIIYCYIIGCKDKVTT